MSEPTPAHEALPAWLLHAIDNPPPAPDPEELARSERHSRFSEMGPIRDRLPRFLVEPKAPELRTWIQHPVLLDVALRWTWGSGNVVMLGSTGQGKTSAAGLLFRRLLRDGWRDGGAAWANAQGMRWCRAEQLEREMRAHPLGKGECQLYRDAIGAKLLVLDELGWEQDHKAIASVLAARYDRPNPTIITSGRTMAELRETYGDAVVRRMVQGGRVVKAFPGLVEPRPPGDQGELARRQGERL